MGVGSDSTKGTTNPVTGRQIVESHLQAGTNTIGGVTIESDFKLDIILVDD